MSGPQGPVDTTPKLAVTAASPARVANGLAEIAVNQGRADRDLGLGIGIPVEIVS